jgi:hypothetical protein
MPDLPVTNCLEMIDQALLRHHAHLAGELHVRSFLHGVSYQDKTMITLLVDVFNGSKISKNVKVCSSTIHHRKRNLALAIHWFMGLDIIIDIQRRPG